MATHFQKRKLIFLTGALGFFGLGDVGCKSAKPVNSKVADESKALTLQPKHLQLQREAE